MAEASCHHPREQPAISHALIFFYLLATGLTFEKELAITS